MSHNKSTCETITFSNKKLKQRGEECTVRQRQRQINDNNNDDNNNEYKKHKCEANEIANEIANEMPNEMVNVMGMIENRLDALNKYVHRTEMKISNINEMLKRHMAHFNITIFCLQEQIKNINNKVEVETNNKLFSVIDDNDNLVIDQNVINHDGFCLPCVKNNCLDEECMYMHRRKDNKIMYCKHGSIYGKCKEANDHIMKTSKSYMKNASIENVLLCLNYSLSIYKDAIKNEDYILMSKINIKLKQFFTLKNLEKN